MRLFIAIPVPPDIRRALGAVKRELMQKGAVGRYVPDNNYHVTLHFFGESDALCDIADAMHEAVCDARPFLLRLGEYGGFSSRAIKTGVVEMTGDLSELTRLYEMLESALLERGFVKSTGRFRPHITIGRNMQGDEVALTQHNDAFTVNQIVLYESRSEKGQMVYTPVHKELFL